MATKKEKVTVTKDDVGEVNVDELTEGSENEGLAMESAKVELSGDVNEMQSPNCYDAVFGFASYLSTVKTFKAGTRGNASILAQHAADFCAENNWEESSDDFPDNIKHPE